MEDYLCERKEQLLSRERFWIENNDCVNKNFPTRTVKEWNEVNKDKLKMYNKKYRASTKGKEHKKEYLEKNKDNIKERNRIYFESNKDEILKQQKLYNSLHKEEKQLYDENYYNKNRETKNEKSRQHYQKNKDVKNKKQNERKRNKRKFNKVIKELSKYIKLN